MEILRRTVGLSYLIFYRNLVIVSSVLSQNQPHVSIQPYHHHSKPSHPDDSFYSSAHYGDQMTLGPNRRQDDGNFLTSPAADIIEIGVTIILGGAAIATGIEAGNSAREISVLQSRFTTVCGALQRAAAVSTESVSLVPILDPVGRNALSQVNDVIRALANITSASCNF